MDKDKLEPLLQIVLAAVAKECGKKQDDLSVGLYRTLIKFGEECFWLGDREAHDRPTIETPPAFPAVDPEPEPDPKDEVFRQARPPRIPTRRATPPPPPPGAYRRGPLKPEKPKK